ncbi:MAG: tRNA pseudouridine(13) synthase TruD [Glaciecola sp.]
MLNLTVNNWHYLHGGPLFDATIKQSLVDFKVTETLSFEPSGSGEHQFLYIEKAGQNTAFVAEELAKFAKLPLRAVSYAGRKDKYATTYQWFGIYFGGKQQKSRKSPVVKPSDINWNDFSLPGVRILQYTQNDRKLRTGSIKHNAFDIVLRNIDSINTTQLHARLSQIRNMGVPNYFGNQRFGEIIKSDGSVQLGGNLQLAEKLVNGEAIRNRNKNSMAISALRSWLFNQFVSHRLQQTDFLHVLDGDALSLSGSNSFFIANNTSDEHERLISKDINLTAPMWGKGQLDTKAQALAFEQQLASQYQPVCTTLEALSLEQQRRNILLYPQDLQAEVSEHEVCLRFSLPSGCFATSVLREIAQVNIGRHAE